MIYTPILKPFRLNKKGAIDATYECATMAEAVANAYEGYFCYVKADKLHYKFILVDNVLTAVRDVAVDASVLATKTEVDAKAAKTYVDAELAKKSDTAHTHPYAPLAHDHGTLYIRAADLQPYALASDMAQRAMTNHNHDTAYSALNHAHDTAYSALNHNHDSSYIAASVLSSLATRTEIEAKAALNHTHTNVYAEISHIHANYANIGHLHDERYITRAEVVSAGGVQQYVHPTTDGNHHVPATGTSNNGKFLKSGALAGSEAWQSITAADVTTNADSRFTSDTELSTIVSNATNAIATARSEAIAAAASDATTKADTARSEAIEVANSKASKAGDTFTGKITVPAIDIILNSNYGFKTEQINLGIFDLVGVYKYVILLHPTTIGAENIPDYNYCIGTIKGFGTFYSGFMQNIAQIHTAASGYMSINSLKSSQSNMVLVRCTYNGTKYVAVKLEQSGGGFNKGIYFDGCSQSTSEKMLVVCYNSNNTITNKEINDSIVAISSTLFNSGNQIIDRGANEIVQGSETKENVTLGTYAVAASTKQLTLTYLSQQGNTYLSLAAIPNGVIINIKIGSNTSGLVVYVSGLSTPLFNFTSSGNKFANILKQNNKYYLLNSVDAMS